MTTEKPKPVTPPTEVPEKSRRRSFSTEYKHQILAECDGATEPGQIGAILRREGLYSSHLVEWRRLRDRGELVGTKRRGPVPAVPDARDARIAELERENARLAKRATRAEAMVELQKKVADLLGTTLLSLDETL